MSESTVSHELPLLLTRDAACRLLGIKLSQYKKLVIAGLLSEVHIGERGRRLPLEEAFRFAREGVDGAKGPQPTDVSDSSAPASSARRAVEPALAGRLF